MPQFVVDPVKYDFTIYRSSAETGMGKGEGVIPEPSDGAIERFHAAREAMSEELGLTDQAELAAAMAGEQTELVKKIMGMSREQRRAFQRDLEERSAAIYADLCSNSPSAEEILSVNERVRKLFFLYVQKEMFNPNL